MQSYGDFKPVGAISIVYRSIHVQPYAISGQKCLVRTRNNPLLCTVNDTECLRRKALNPVDDTRCLLIILWHRTVIDWLANQTSNRISVMSLLIFSAIDWVLCVDGKCYRLFDRRLLPPLRSHGTSIDTSSNWLCTCLIDRVKHQPIGW